MSYVHATSVPVTEPVSLAQARSFLRLPDSYVREDATITGFIAAAREQGEILTGRSLAQRTWRMVLDSHPYYTDTIQSQLAYPPSYYSLPKYSTTLWNYSQMIKLYYPPVISVQQIRSIQPDGSVKTALQDVDFVLDRDSQPARIFPLPSQFWPADLYVPNSVVVDYTAGYDPDPTKIDTHNIASPPTSNPGQQPDSVMAVGIPQMIIVGILNLVSYWYQNRGAVGQVPENIERIFQQNMIVDFAPTRG